MRSIRTNDSLYERGRQLDTKIITLQIGNSDDTLTQSSWSKFVEEIRQVVVFYASTIHFAGGSSGEKPRQNYCWVFEVKCDQMNEGYCKDRLRSIREIYEQESVAWTEGNTLFI